MPLSYDTRKCNPPTVQNEKERCDHYVLCTMSMLHGIPEITEENIAEVYARIQSLELEYGGWRLANDGQIKFTLEEVRRWIGMKTNVAPISKRKFWCNHKKVNNDANA